MALPESIVGVLIHRFENDVDPLVFDATVESVGSQQATITNNPVETNEGDVTDHRRTGPRMWRFRAIFVNEDPDPIVPAQRAASADGGARDPLKSARENGPQVDHVRAVKLLGILQAIFRSHETVSVTTDLDVLDRAVIESLSYRVLASMHDPEFSGQMQPSAIEVSGTFKEIRFADTLLEYGPPIPAPEVKRQTGKKVKRGDVEGKPADEETKKKAQSFLRLFTGGLD